MEQFTKLCTMQRTTQFTAAY